MEGGRYSVYARLAGVRESPRALRREANTAIVEV